MSSKSKISRAKSTAVLSTMVLLGIFAAFAPKTLARYSGGTGEPNDPYRIATAENLNDIGDYQEDWDKHFILVNDVNLANYTGTQFNIIGKWFDWNDPNNKPFTGVFDGNDHKIWSFTWTSDGIDCIGLFRYVGIGGQIKNLCLEIIDLNAINGYLVGGLVGYIEDGDISNCYSTGSVSGYSRVGGLVGENYGTIIKCYSTGYVNGTGWCIGGLAGVNVGIITNCYSTSSVTGISSVGGLVGENFKGTISTCYSSGSVNGWYYVGGLMGLLDMGSVSNCYSTSDVNGSDRVGGLVGWNLRNVSNSYSTGSVSGNEAVGGLVGYNVGIVSNCYSTGDVNGVEVVGGLVGGNGFFYPFVVLAPGNIFNSYSTGKVQGVLSVGGLVGYNYYGDIEKSFWDAESSGEPNMCGGQNEEYATGCDPNCGKTTAEMKTKSTFSDVGWDFVEVWGIGEGQTYPYLLTGPAGDFNYDKEVNFIDLAILASHWLEEK